MEWPLIIVGAVLSLSAGAWWANELHSMLGEEASRSAFYCLLKVGTGDCAQLWFVGLHQTNQFASLLFYVGILTIIYAVSHSKRGRELSLGIIGLITMTVIVIDGIGSVIRGYEQTLKQEKELDINVAQLVRKLQYNSNRLDGELKEFPDIERKYRIITIKIKAYSDRAYTYKGNAGAVAQIQYAMSQGLYATNQVHFQVQSLEGNFQATLIENGKQYLLYKNQCKNKNIEPVCTKLVDAGRSFRPKAQAVLEGLNHLEQTYKVEYKKQNDLIEAAEHLQ